MNKNIFITFSRWRHHAAMLFSRKMLPPVHAAGAAAIAIVVATFTDFHYYLRRCWLIRHYYAFIRRHAVSDADVERLRLFAFSTPFT